MVPQIMLLTEQDMGELNPIVWAEGGGQGLLNIPPIKIEMQSGILLVRKKQYLISPEGQRGLTPVMQGLVEEGILEPGLSPHTAPILAVKKVDGTYRLVQDLREINK